MKKTLIILGLLSCNPESTEPRDAAEEVAEAIEPASSIELGNVKFIFKLDSGFSEAEKADLIEKMKAAHARLSNILGTDVMTLSKSTMVNVYKTDINEARGRVQYENTNVKINQDLEPKLQGDSLGEITLQIGEISEANLAHEFTHLFAQSSYFWSEAFNEGMVYGLIHYLYPDYYTSMPDFHIKAVQEKCVAALFDKGWDYDQLDVALQKGIKEGELQTLLHSQWAVIWADFFKNHTGFPKYFFNVILLQRKNGKLDFTKEELIQIASQASSDFESWMNTRGKSTRQIETQSAFFAVKTGFEEFVVLNFTARAEDTSDGTLNSGLMLQGKVGQSLIVAPDGNVGTFPTTAFGKITASGISSLPSFNVTVGGELVPFLDAATCEAKTF